MNIEKQSTYLILTVLFLACTKTIFGQIPSLLSENNMYNRPGDAEWLNDFKLSIDLVENKGIDSLNTDKTFSFNSKTGLVETWGRGTELPGVYFDENLPLFFLRQLNFSSFSPDNGVLEWIFTGRLGGVTVAASADSIWLIQRFYGAYGFNNLVGDKLEMSRHPEKIWSVSRTAYSGEIKSIALISNHKIEIQLFVNGQKIATQRCLQDLSHHQLRFVGNHANILGKLMKPISKKVNIRINENVRYQKMLGWGGIAISTAYKMLSEKGKEKWWQFISEYNLLVHREYPIGQLLNEQMDNWDNQEDAMVHYYGDNFPNSEISDFNYIKKIQELGGINIFEFWKFPPWVKEDTKSNQSNSAVQVNVENYCKAMINYCQTAKTKTGKAPAIVGIQNERALPAKTWQKMTLALRSALDNNGFEEVKIHMHNASNLNRGIAAAKAFTSSKEVWGKVDFSATNMYDYQGYFANPDGYDEMLQEFKSIIGDKPFLSTELSVNSPFYQISSYRLAFAMAQLYHKNLVIANASSIMYCWILLNNVQATYDATRSLFGIDEIHGNVPKPSGFQTRAFGAFSRRIKKDMQRMGASSDFKDLLFTFYSGQPGETAVLLNRSLQPVVVDISTFNFTPLWIEKVSYFAENEVMKWDKNKNLTIQPGEIITLSNVSLNELK
jgi:hypothetical protein